MVQRNDGEDIDLVDGLETEAVLIVLDNLGAVGGAVASEFLRGVEVAAHGEGAGGFDVGRGGASVEVDGLGVEVQEAGADLAG